MPHVLIVDDDASTREALSAIIGEDGLSRVTTRAAAFCRMRFVIGSGKVQAIAKDGAGQISFCCAEPNLIGGTKGLKAA